MAYIHIPVDFQNPTDRDFEQFCAIMEQLKDVSVHVLGMGEPKARADMKSIWHPEGVWADFVRR